MTITEYQTQIAELETLRAALLKKENIGNLYVVELHTQICQLQITRIQELNEMICENNHR